MLSNNLTVMMRHLSELAECLDDADMAIEGVHKDKVSLEDLATSQENLNARLNMVHTLYDKIYGSAQAKHREMNRIRTDYLDDIHNV